MTSSTRERPALAADDVSGHVSGHIAGTGRRARGAMLLFHVGGFPMFDASFVQTIGVSIIL